jgi:hypothetical protein
VSHDCSSRVLAFCQGVVRDAPAEELELQIGAVVRRLEEPIRIAVAGRVKAGKSTLVNALLGRRIAPTDVSECTKVVTWYRAGFPERVEVRLRSGRTQDLALTRSGGLPDFLGAAVQEIREIHVFLPERRLREMTVIDTPGLSSVNEQYSDETRRLMHGDSAEAAGGADAIVFLMPGVVKRDDADALADFADLMGAAGASPFRSVGILSKADQLAGGDAEQVRALARHFADDLSGRVATVVPLVGLFAETARCGGLTESDVRHLREVAALDGPARRLLLLSADRFRAGAPMPADAAERLLRLLDRRGIEQCLEHVEAGRDASSITRELESLAGIESLEEIVATTFLAHTDALKATAALAALERIATSAAAPPTLRGALERLRLEPAMTRIALLWAAQESAAVELPDELRADLERFSGLRPLADRLGVASGADGDALSLAARTGAGRWRAFANDPWTSFDGRRVGAAVCRAYEALVFTLRSEREERARV